ncbi:MAG: magnesium/cobalt efflux protein, partial [Sphingomonadales bacterium]|nr:magnesium/cobalt efflux protein [Sphingomonadales bacterium]
MNEESSSPGSATPSGPATPHGTASGEHSSNGKRDKSYLKVLADWLSGRSGETARDALEELIDEPEEGEASLGPSERQLLGNILDLHGRTIADVMVPRVDIVALKAETNLERLIALIAEEGHSRLPLYRKTLDDAF